MHKLKHKCTDKSSQTIHIFRFDSTETGTKIGTYSRCRRCGKYYKILSSINRKGKIREVLLGIGESIKLGDKEIKFTEEEYNEYCTDYESG